MPMLFVEYIDDEYNDCEDVFSVSINGALSIFSHTLLAINWLQCQILPK